MYKTDKRHFINYETALLESTRQAVGDERDVRIIHRFKHVTEARK